MKIIIWLVVLHFDDEQAAFTVFDQHVGAVEFVGGVLLIAFAFQESDDAQVLAQEGGQETFQYDVVAFVPKQTLHGPIESD